MAGETFSQARATVSQIEAYVTDKLDDLGALATTQATAATTIANQLGALVFDDPDAPPAAPSVTFDFEPFELEEVDATSFGTITATAPITPGLTDIEVTDPGEAPTFTPTVAYAAPTFPTLDSHTAPTAPEITEVTLPDSPDLVRPLLADLEQIVIPTFTFPEIEDFSAALPEFEGATPITTLQWSEPTYTSEILDEVMTQLRAFWSGDTGLPEAVEQAMWERMASREDLALARQIADVAAEFSSRGFTMPPGMQAARVDALREDGIIKKLSASREVAIEVAKIHVENCRVAVQQGIAAENVLTNIFLNGAQRMFEAAKYSVQAQIELHGAMVALYNARMNGYGIQAQVYKTQLDARLAEIEVFKAQLEGEIAKGTINEQRVRSYAAQIDAMRADVEVYRARMEGAKVQADIEKVRIDRFKSQVDAHASLLGAEKLKIDGYVAQVQGEAAKANFADAEAKVFAALIQGHTAEVELSLQTSRVQIEAQRALTERFRAEIEGMVGVIQGQAATVEANSKAFIADTQRYVAQAGASAEQARLGISAQETQLRSNLALYEAQIGLYTAQANKAVQEAGLRLEAIKAAAQISSTLSAGAMAALNVGATISGSSGISASGSVNLGQSASETYSYNVSSTAAGAGAPLESASLASQAW